MRHGGAVNARQIGWIGLLGVSFVVYCALMAGDPQLHEWQNADSLTHVMMASENWQPYFWGQDRLGMGYSWFFRGVGDPLHRLWMMDALFLGLWVAAFAFFWRWYIGEKRALLSGLCAGLIFVAVAIPYQLFVVAVEHPEYAGALVPLCLGLILAERGRYGWLAGLCVLFGTWINISAPLLMGGMGLLRFLVVKTPDAQTRIRREFCYLGGSFIVVFGLTKVFVQPEQPTNFELSGFSASLLGFYHMGKNSLQLLPQYWVIGVVGLLHLGRHGSLLEKRQVVALWLGGLGFLGFLATLKHTGDPGFGGYRACYSIPSIIVIWGTLSLWVGHFTRNHIGKLKFAVLLLPVLGLLKHGVPERQKIEAVYERRFGVEVREMLDHGVTHHAGRSWSVMGRHFWLEKVAREEGKFVPWPLTMRDGLFQKQWRRASPQTWLIALEKNYFLEQDYHQLQRRFPSCHWRVSKEGGIFYYYKINQ